MPANPTTILSSVLQWLRGGYPDGVPREDYVALLAVLRHKLTDTEVREVVAALTEDQKVVEPITSAEIESAIVDQSLQEASDEDVARVRARLAAGGWPLARPSDV